MLIDRSEARRAAVLLILFVAALLVLVFAFSRIAAARDAADRYVAAPHAEWYKSQHNALGQWCCDESDGHPFYGGYSLNPDGSATLDTGRGPHHIPAHMVLTGPNPTGHAVWWKLGDLDFCFAPGPLG